jgi:hypothetical protein
MQGAGESRDNRPDRIKCNYPGCDYEGTTENLNKHFRMKHGGEYEPSGDYNPPASKTAKQIFYISRRPMLRTVRSSVTTPVVNSMGQVTRTQTVAPIKVSFELLTSGRGMFVLNEQSAKQLGSTFEELKELIESDSDYKDGGIWVGTTDEQFAKAGPAITQGTRSTKR